MDNQLASGPYRATILWNSLIRNFRADIPLARHRRYMKTYDDSFVASEAVEWLHQYLKKNPNFGTDVSRAQTVQLLQKLHKARVFEDVRGPKHNRGDFTDSGRLFRLTLGSPAKSVRTPIALRNNLKLANLRRSPSIKPLTQPVKLDFNKMSSMPSIPDNTTTLPECHFMSKPLSAYEIEDEWKSMTLMSLQTVLGIDGLDDIMDERLVSGKHVMHNCLYVNKSGVVTNIDSKDQLPHWALSAMKCLAYWPDKIDNSLPNYPGFEKDVFRVVKDYFCGLPEPLMTYNMYEVITNVFVEAENSRKGRQSSSNICEFSNSTPKIINTFKSVENLLLNLTRNVTRSYKPSSECQDASEGYSSSNILDLSPIQHISASSPQGTDDGTQPVTKYETAFGPDNRTVTRVFYADGISTDFNHTEGESETEHTPIETHFDGSPPDVHPSSFSRKSSIRHSVNNLFNRGSSIREKKLRREKTMNRRRSAGFNLNDEKSYGCSVGVYTRNVSDTSYNNTPVSRLAPLVRSESCAGTGQSTLDRKNMNSTKPPRYANPPSYDTLYPETRYAKSHHHPVIDGSKKLKRKKSISSASLNKRKSFLDSSDSRREESMKGANKCCDMDSVVPGRSLSMSDLAAAPPIENELQKQCMGKTGDSEDSVFADDGTERIVQALQLVLLLIPPANRRRLHLLLRLMNKISTNEKLVLDETQPSRNLLLETFYRAILCCQDESDMDDLLVIQLVAFLMDHYTEILTVPTGLKSSVEGRITKLQRTKVKSEKLRVDIEIRYSSDDTSSLHYCKQVSLEEYENQRMSSSQQALATLLEEIVSDKSMAQKDKKKRLKQFQKLYPEIYLRRFPSSECETETFPPRPRIKPQLLAKPLLKLKGLRL